MNVDYLECNIIPGVRVLADKEQVHRVIVNVLQNAVQSIPEDRKGELRIRTDKVGQNVVIRIRDNGVGIPAEIREKFSNLILRPRRAVWG